jgi:hypothetical protein
MALPALVQMGLKNYTDLSSKATKNFILEYVHCPCHVTEFNNTIYSLQTLAFSGHGKCDVRTTYYTYSFMFKNELLSSTYHIKA